MADEFDNASALEELERDLALANRQKTQMPFTGMCYNCHEKLKVATFVTKTAVKTGRKRNGLSHNASVNILL